MPISFSVREAFWAFVICCVIWGSGWYGNKWYEHEVPTANPSYMRGFEAGETRQKLRQQFEGRHLGEPQNRQEVIRKQFLGPTI